MKLQFGLRLMNGKTCVPQDWTGPKSNCDRWTPEVSGAVLDGPVLMFYRGDRITFEEECEVQPYQYGVFTITFDGRLDNRQVIADQAALVSNVTTPDPVLILQAYAQHGDNVLKELIGEFALTIWDRSRRTLTFSRSVDGARPLYYKLEPQRLIWSSHLGHLLSSTEQSPTVNDTYVRQFLVSVPESDITAFADIRVVPPGAAIHFQEDGRSTLVKLWEPPPPDELVRSDADYAEEFLQKITDAIAVRLRSKNPVFSELSGGLDSSTIALIGHKVLLSRNQSPQRLRTISCIYRESETCDERPFIHQIENQRHQKSIYVEEEEQSITIGLRDRTVTSGPNPLMIHAGRYAAYKRHMDNYGARVVLTGNGGDDIFGCNPDATPLLADLLCKGQLLRMHHEAREWSCLSGRPYWRLLLAQVVPLAIGPVLPRSLQYAPAEFPVFLTKDCKNEICAKKWDAGTRADLAVAPSRRGQLRSVELLFRVIAAGYFANFPELYVSHPYTHRPLIEFCLRTPFSQFVRHGEFRSIMRRALKDILPPKILQRRTKSSMDEAILRAIQRDWHDIGDLRSWEVCKRGYVDVVPFQKVLTKLRTGIQDQLCSVLNTLAVEQWLRSVETFIRNKPLMHPGQEHGSALHALGGAAHAKHVS